jgi:trimeric autotransporter adhesin
MAFQFSNEALPLPIMVPYIPLTTSAGNTLVGLNSDPSITSGTFNAGLGEYTLTSTTIGSFNSAFGAQAMQFNISGLNNAAYGFRSMYNNISGAGNSCFGNQSGTDIITGAGNIVLGNFATAGAADAINRVVVGNLATGVYDNCLHVVGGAAPITDFYFPDLASTAPLANVLYYDTTTGLIRYGNDNGGTQTFLDGTFRIQNTATNTKQVAFNCVNISAATTRTINVPNNNCLLPAYVAGNLSLALGNTSYTFTGINDTIIGIGAGNSLTSGTNNTALGYQAMFNTTNGASITCVGNQAFYTGTGSNIVAVGDQALYSSTVGAHNVALGPNAGYGTTDGSYNTFLGSNAMPSGASATSCVAVGFYSLFSNIADDNIGIGHQVLLNSYSGIQNIGMGTRALNTLISGANNIGLGFETGSGLNSGNNNILVGSSITALAGTNSGNVIIGHNLSFVASPVDSQANGCVVISAQGNNRGFFSNAVRNASGGLPISYNSVSGEFTYFTAVVTTTFLDSAFRVQNSVDPTKQLAFNCVNIGTTTTRTMVVPNNSGILPALVNSTSLSLGNTAYTYSGVNNTTVGVLSGNSLTTGNNNASYGYNSLASASTHSFNAAFGVQALQSTIVDGATAMGYQALSSLTTGLYNAAFGYQSLKACVVGGYNASFGYGALSAFTGNYNTAMGYNALNATIAGNLNTAVGAESLLNATGSVNTGCGSGSLKALTSGNNNTAFGASAGASLTTGSNNIIVGDTSVTPANNTTGSILIGSGVTGKTGVVSGNGNNVVSILVPTPGIGAYCNALRQVAGTSSVQYIEATGEIVYVPGSVNPAFVITTTDATVTTAYTQPVAASKTIIMTTNITAIRSNLTAGAAYVIKGAFKNNAGTVTQIQTTIKEAFEDDLAWDVNYSISGTNVLVRVTGVAATTITWTGSLSIT